MVFKKLVIRSLAVVLIVSAISSIGVATASWADSYEVMTGSTSGAPVRWTNVSRVDTSLSYSGTTAKCKVEIEAFSGTT